MRKLLELSQWGGVSSDGARDKKHPNAAMTRNVLNGPDGSVLTARGGSTQTVEGATWPTFNIDRSFDTIWAFTLAKYPGLVFVAQVAATGEFDANGDWAPDITGTSAIKCVGVFKPEHLSTDVTSEGKTETAAGGMIPTVRGSA
jgi:hypothetical protein